jgi:hypothetical protein
MQTSLPPQHLTLPFYFSLDTVNDPNHHNEVSILTSKVSTIITMHILPTLLLSIATALAAPTPQTPATNPSTTHLYICTDASFRENCMNMQLEVSSCRA